MHTLTSSNTVVVLYISPRELHFVFQPAAQGLSRNPPHARTHISWAPGANSFPWGNLTVNTLQKAALS